MSIFKSAIMTNNETWYIFDSDQWGTWTRMSLTGDNPFAAGPVRPQYDYAGADIIFRVEAQVAQLLPGANNTTNMSDLVWTAGAKPFGAAGPDGTLVPSQYGLVFPCFTDVRLVPVDACSGAANGTFNTGWRQHVDVDLPRYVKTGQLAAGCWYCQQLKTWDNPSRAFQEEGLTWLSSNKYQCVQHGGGGGGGGGGTSHGH